MISPITFICPICGTPCNEDENETRIRGKYPHARCHVCKTVFRSGPLPGYFITRKLWWFFTIDVFVPCKVVAYITEVIEDEITVRRIWENDNKKD